MANIVKSVEKFDLALSALTVSGQLSKSQNVDNCVPFMSTRGNSSTMRAHITDAYFSSTGSDDFINVARAYNNGTNYCKVYVVEFDPNEVKVQQGSFTLDGTTNTTVTISGVDQDRAAMSFYNVGTTGTDYASANLVRGKFASNSSLEFRRGTTNQSVNGHYFVFEALKDQFTVQSSDWSNVSTTDIELNPMSFVKGLLLSSYYSDYGGNSPPYHYARTFLWSRKNIRINKSSGSSTVYGTSFFIEFADNKRHTQQWYPYFSSSATSVQYDLKYPVDLDYSMAILDNFQSIVTVSFNNSSYTHNAFCTAELLTASGVEIYRNNSGAVSYGSLQVFDWKGVDISIGSNSSPLASGISCVKSVENSIITITGEDKYIDYALTKGQDISNCVPFISSRGDSNTYSKQMYNVWFESPNLVCINRGGNTGAISVIHLNIVEFYPEQVKVNSDVIYISGQYYTTTISSVDLSKTVLIFNGSLATNGNADSSYVRGKFTSASGIELYRMGTAGNWNGTYYTFEDLKNNFEVEQHTGSFSSYSRDYATMELEPACTFLIGSYAINLNGTSASYAQAMLTYQSTSIAGFNKYSSSYTCYYCYFMVKFIDGREHVQNIYQYFSSSDSTKTQSLYDRFIGHNDSIIAYSNTCPGSEVNTNNSSYIKFGWCSIELLPNNTLEMKLISAPSVDVKTAFSVIDWVGYKPTFPIVLKTKSFVRSIENIKFTLIDNDYQDIKYLTKGQISENCVPFYTLKSSSSNAGTYESMVACLIFTGNKIAACRGMYGSGMGRIDMTASVIEFNPNKVKIQRGHFYVSGTSTDITVEEVDLHRAFVVVSSYGYGVSNKYSHSFLESYFTNSTTLTVQRTTSDSGAIMGQYYIVEALNEEFYVQTVRGSTNSSIHNILYPEYTPTTSKSILIASVRSNYDGNGPSYGCTRIYNDLQSVYTNKYSSNSNTYYTIFVVDFDKSLDIVTQQRFFSFSSSESVKESSINKVSENSTAIVVPTQSVNSTVNTTNAGHFPYAFSEIVLTTSGTKVEASLSQAPGVDVRSFAQIVEFPEFSTHYFDGTVTERGLPAAGRIVRAYRRDTGDLMDETVSASGTGYFYLETTYSGAHDIVCLDDLAGYSYNDLIYGDVLPTVISGAP